MGRVLIDNDQAVPVLAEYIEVLERADNDQVFDLNRGLSRFIAEYRLVRRHSMSRYHFLFFCAGKTHARLQGGWACCQIIRL